MSKELEKIKRLTEYFEACEEIENAKPSGALEEFYALANAIVDDSIIRSGEPLTATIKHQAFETLMRTERMQKIEQALIRLNGFDKTYEDVKSLPFEEILDVYKDDLVIDILINAYEKLKSTKSKKEQAWDILVKKNIEFHLIKFFVADGWSYENACRDYECIRRLTEEEFDLLKSEVLK